MTDYRALFTEIEEAASRGAVYRDKPLRVMAVTKTREPDVINALPSEIDLIGENKVQELLTKKPALDPRFELHFIGQLQLNKVKYIIDKVSMIHSVDRLPLAAEIDKRASRYGRVMPVLCEVNIAGEASKGGCDPAEVESLVAAMSRLEHLECHGLMCVAGGAPPPPPPRGGG
ncbi:MAG: alanine racemase [Eubacteriales bacterium]|nr:alanine racemase [Eubacteriales bacterium]